MKPIHEQEWHVVEESGREPVVLDGYGLQVAEVTMRWAREGQRNVPQLDEVKRRAKAIAALPDMARDLFSDLEDHGGAFSSDPCKCDRCIRKRGALRKGGFL